MTKIRKCYNFFKPAHSFFPGCSLENILINNPWLLNLITLVSCCLLPIILLFAMIGIATGRTFSTPFFTIGPKEPSKSETPPTFQNVINNNAPGMTTEQMDQLAERITQKAETIKQQDNQSAVKYYYQPPALPEHLAYILSVRFDIEQKVASIVLTYGGPWAGSSMATADKFFDLASRHNLIPKQLEQEIADFYSFTQIFLRGLTVDDNSMLRIQYLASYLARELDYVASQTSNDKSYADNEHKR